MAQTAKGALSSSELNEALAQHPGWRSKGKAIARTLKCKGFPEAIELVNQIAAIAQRLDHHPDILIEFDKLTFTLSTHDSGGVTQRDLNLAAAIDGAAAKAGAHSPEQLPASAPAKPGDKASA